MTEWHPTPELRFAVPPYTTTAAPKLQQLWVTDTVNRFDHARMWYSERQSEWRDVPMVVANGETMREEK